MSLSDAQSCVRFFLICLSNARSIFEQFLVSTQLSYVWESFVFILVVVPFILGPFMAHSKAGSSDSVKRRTRKKEG